MMIYRVGTTLHPKFFALQMEAKAFARRVGGTVEKVEVGGDGREMLAHFLNDLVDQVSMAGVTPLPILPAVPPAGSTSNELLDQPVGKFFDSARDRLNGLLRDKKHILAEHLRSELEAAIEAAIGKDSQ